MAYETAADSPPKTWFRGIPEAPGWYWATKTQTGIGPLSLVLISPGEAGSWRYSHHDSRMSSCWLTERSFAWYYGPVAGPPGPPPAG